MNQGNLETWWKRWRDARAKHYSSAEKLAEAIRVQFGLKASRLTTQAWELPRTAKRSRFPGRQYRSVLSEMHAEFAALIAELPEQAKAAAASAEKEDLRDALAELRGMVDALNKTAGSLRRRIVALERRPPGEAPGTAQGADGP